MSESTEKKTAQKTCPKCNNIVADNVTECNECGYKFENKPISPKAPRKPCPKCGNKVPIRVVACNVCDYQFPFKDGTTAKTQRKPKSSSNSQSNSTAISSVKKDGRNPFKALQILAIWSVIYGLLLVLLLSLVFNLLSGIWFALLASVTVIISFFVGIFVGMACDYNYGKHSLTPIRVYAFVICGGFCLFDYFYFTFTVAKYSGASAWGMGAMVVSITVYVFSSVRALYAELKSSYCPHCRLTGVVHFEKQEVKKEYYANDYVTHAAHTETTYVTVRDKYYNKEEYKIKYKVPEYQENLGLHKFTTKENSYVCEICGRRKVDEYTSKEKVG